MNLRHIEIFHAVYVNGSVSAAARALNVSQPSVSKTLRRAEALFGAALFERTGGRLVPTDEAHALIAEVTDIQQRVAALREGGHGQLGEERGLLRISALPSIALEALPTAVSRFLKAHPRVRFDLQTVHHQDLMRELRDHESDIVIANEVPADPALGRKWLGEGELVVLYREDDMPGAPQRLSLDQLCSRPFVSLAASGPIGDLFSSELRRRGLVLSEGVSARTFYIATQLVRAGVGITVVDNLTAQAAMVPGLAMRGLRPAITFDIHAMYLLSRPLGPLASEFLRIMGEVVESL